MPSPIIFTNGGTDILEESGPALAAIGAFLEKRPEITLLRIESHVSTATKNGQVISEMRAATVMRDLITRGVSCERLLAVGFGTGRSIADNATWEGRSKNNRMEFYVAQLRGKPLAGLPENGGGVTANEPCDKNKLYIIDY